MRHACKQKMIGSKRYYCYFELTLGLISGKWKAEILYRLGDVQQLRFGEFKKVIPHVTEKMLGQQLKELERDGLIERKTYNQLPPKVEYRLSDLGLGLLPMLKQMRTWGVEYEKRFENAQQYLDGGVYEHPSDEPAF